jgi:hypothetical protein
LKGLKIGVITSDSRKKSEGLEAGLLFAGQIHPDLPVLSMDAWISIGDSRVSILKALSTPKRLGDVSLGSDCFSGRSLHGLLFDVLSVTNPPRKVRLSATSQHTIPHP